MCGQERRQQTASISHLLVVVQTPNNVYNNVHIRRMSLRSNDSCDLIDHCQLYSVYHHCTVYVGQWSCHVGITDEISHACRCGTDVNESFVNLFDMLSLKQLFKCTFSHGQLKVWREHIEYNPIHM